MRKTDFHYTSNGLTFSLWPNNKQAENAWAELEKHCDPLNMPAYWLPSIKTQLKTAGYSVRKMNQPTINHNDDDLIKRLTA